MDLFGMVRGVMRMMTMMKLHCLLLSLFNLLLLLLRFLIQCWVEGPLSVFIVEERPLQNIT
jgi:hypothetical protein